MQNTTTSVIVPAVTESSLVNYDGLEEWEGEWQERALKYVMMVVLGFVILIGGLGNVSSVIILIRRRLWLQNEGYIHLLAILVSNIAIIVIVDFPHWISLFRRSYHIGATANAVCKVWYYLAYVVFSTGWYVVALLLGVYLRDRRTRGLGPRCCQRLAVKYRTLTGSKVIVGVISGAFAVMNLWLLWSAQMIELHSGDESFLYCHVADLNHHIYVWEHVAMFIIWVLPVTVIVPGLLVAILWTRRGSCAGVGGSSSGGGDGFSHRRMNEEEGGQLDDGGFAMASLWIGQTVYLLESPVIVVYICMIFGYHGSLYVAYGITHILAVTHVAVVPILCLAMIAPMRKEVQLATAAGKCCPCRDEEEDDVMGILQMDSMAEQSSAGTD